MGHSVFMTNRKLHMRFRLTPRSMTLDYLELWSLNFQRISQISDATTAKGMNIYQYCQRLRNCKQVELEQFWHAFASRGFVSNSWAFLSVFGSRLWNCLPRMLCDTGHNTAIVLVIFRHFYRAVHYSAKRGLAIACHLSVRSSVCPSVCDVGGLWSQRLEFFENNFTVS